MSAGACLEPGSRISMDKLTSFNPCPLKRKYRFATLSQFSCQMLERLTGAAIAIAASNPDMQREPAYPGVLTIRLHRRSVKPASSIHTVRSSSDRRFVAESMAGLMAASIFLIEQILRIPLAFLKFEGGKACMRNNDLKHSRHRSRASFADRERAIALFLRSELRQAWHFRHRSEASRNPAASWLAIQRVCWRSRSLCLAHGHGRRHCRRHCRCAAGSAGPWHSDPARSRRMTSRGRARLISFSISFSMSCSSTQTSDTASPVAPARPVRPMRCT